MTRKRSPKPYWEMTTAELREATKEFDEEFRRGKEPTAYPEEQALWEQAKAKRPAPRMASTEQTIAVRLDKTLLGAASPWPRRNASVGTPWSRAGLRSLAAEGE